MLMFYEIGKRESKYILKGNDILKKNIKIRKCEVRSMMLKQLSLGQDYVITKM